MTTFKAAVFDWAGTMIDYGSFAPMGVFVEAFAEFGVEVTVDEARTPMGMPKWDHINTMMQAPRVAEQWAAVRGNRPTRDDVDAVHAVFVPKNEEVVAKYATLVPGAAEMIGNLRGRGMKVGSTTGYTRSIMERVLPVAAAQGYEPDNLVCADDLPECRPGPLGMYKCFVDLVVYPPEAVIKVDDTGPGIAEGVAAGCVTVGVTLSGNYVGKTPEEVAAMSEQELAPMRNHVAAQLRAAGAQHIIDTVADLPALIDSLETA
ncbi:MAG: phosphonoacetaldehyde hydrolase [Rhodospirillales bacterium]|nr:phosphonoacetaldehyde hydrolase [Rhodospirillales bacterium]